MNEDERYTARTSEEDGRRSTQRHFSAWRVIEIPHRSPVSVRRKGLRCQEKPIYRNRLFSARATGFGPASRTGYSILSDALLETLPVGEKTCSNTPLLRTALRAKPAVNSRRRSPLCVVVSRRWYAGSIGSARLDVALESPIHSPTSQSVRCG